MGAVSNETNLSLFERRVGRREFLGLGALAGGSFLLAACGGGSSGAEGGSASTDGVTAPAHPPIGQEPGKLQVYDYAGYEVKPLWRQYAKEHPDDPPKWKFLNSDAEALSTAVAGYRADVVHPCSAYFKRWVDGELLEPFDTSLITNFADLNPELVKSGQFNGKQYVIPTDWGFISILYRTDKVEPEEMSWSLLFDKRYAGKITWYDNPADMLNIGGYVIGADDPFNMTDEELDAVKALFIEAKPAVRNLWNAQTDMENDFAAGNVWITYAWPSSWVGMKAKGLEVEYMEPKEGRLAFNCGFSLFAGTENWHHAHQYVDAWASPESGLWLVNNYAYGHSNTKIDLGQVDAALVSAFELKDPSAIAEPKVHILRYNPRQTDYDKVWQEIKAA
jgi:spermidine/putrescine transport system substrate-binding protein